MEILSLARELKDGGVDWEPAVGCFVWDPHEMIRSPSPFPLRVYFILNMNRFLKIFKSGEAMKEKLIWLPTSHQLRRLAMQCGIHLEGYRSEAPDTDTLLLYRAALATLRSISPSSQTKT